MNLATAAASLRRLPPFENVSLRLLQDLIEFASLREPPESDAVRAGGVPPAPPADKRLWLVVDGVLEVDRAGGRPARRIDPGRYYIEQETDVRVRPAPGYEGRLGLRRFDHGWLGDALEASPTLARTVARAEAAQLLAVREEAFAPRAHRLLLACNPAVNAPLEALAHLLAAGIGGQFPGERVAVVVLEHAGLTLFVWRNDELVEVPMPAELDARFAATAIVLDTVVRRVELEAGDAENLHLVFVHPGDPVRLPEWWRDERFHRIVYLTDRWDVGSGAPRELLRLLVPDAWNPENPHEGPFFGSFIPTVVGPPTPARSTLWLVAPRLPGAGLEDLEHVGVAEEGDFARRDEPIDARWRLFRDRCRIQLELREVARAWAAHAVKRRFAIATLGDAAMKASIERWGRAVTNRQVGVAMSGGGAVNALLVPLLQWLARRVPIDVVSGVSGGALLGAYLCSQNPGGLATFRRGGLVFQVGLLLTMLDSSVIQRTLDWLLGGRRVEDLETRLVAVTTELPTSGVPRARAVIGGTVGQAARVSGAAPGLFGPADGRESRFIDGAATLAVPARVLADFGADIAFAFNAIGPVRERNLLRALALPGLGKAIADVAYYLPMIGRSVDGVTTQFALLQQASRNAADEVDVFYEVPPESLPILRGFQWLRVDELAQEVERREDRWRPTCERMVARWQAFRGGGA